MLSVRIQYLSCLTLCMSVCAIAPGQPPATVWKQKLEVQPAVIRGAEPEKVSADRPVISDQDFHSGLIPEWIWGSDNSRNYVLRTTFEAGSVVAAQLRASCDNSGTVYVNGKRVASGSEWQEPMSADVADLMKSGTNIIEAEVANAGGVAAFVLKLAWKDADGQLHYLGTDDSWQVSEKLGTESSVKASRRGRLGDGPWGNVLAAAASVGRVPPGTFETLPGFRVEKLFTVPKEELGSWVCITTDNRGRLLVSDQGDKGICRITPPGIAGSPIAKTSSRRPVQAASQNATADGIAAVEGGESVVERLDFSACDVQPTAAHGMLWAFDSLYLSINGGPGSGLYRARDLDGDDQFDECVRLKEFRGGGEHGPHSLRLSPDGQRIFVIAGNHTQPPFPAGEEYGHADFRSRIPTNWGEDLLLPRMWDANGHARGVMAPGGWIASTDPDGKTWEIFSVGYRNPYDMAFNADGELFAYDADMEWDIGLPWYRPTRVVHATSGSEFGWRSGSGKWPEYYVDSLPAMVDIGPGSPVGVEFGYGMKFPERYQKALYICDWTFGTMYAIHTEPSQSTYVATKEEFLSRTPLPLTDVTAGHDGALYFTIGGRGTQSELFRVVYVGDESTAPVSAVNSRYSAERARRHELEAFHGVAAHDHDQLTQDSNAVLRDSEEDIRSGDRFLKSASRYAFLNSQLLWKMMDADAFRAADLSNSSPDMVMAIVVAIAKAPLRQIVAARELPDSAVQEWQQAAHDSMIRAMRRLQFNSLTSAQKLEYLRALSLVFIRLGEPDESDRNALASALQAEFPQQDQAVNRELAQMLVSLQSPQIVPALTAMLQQTGRESADTRTNPQTSGSDQKDEISDLLARNRGYGSAIAASLANAPDQQQIWYAYCLRVAATGWTTETRGEFLKWFARAKQWSGGNSFRKFLQNMEDEFWSTTPENERVLLEASGARQPFRMPELPKPVGPGRDWTLEEVRQVATDGLKNRSFDNGQKVYAAARCILCHRFAGEGAATGPDLTQLAGRFDIKALTEAILDPSKVISDQYKASSVVTTDGKSVSGRIISETDTQISVLTDPEDSTKITDIPKKDIEEILPSAVSIMPKDLLKSLNEDEVLDLLAYLLSRGEKNDRMFRR